MTAATKPALPQILIIDLGHRDVEFAAQPVLQALDEVALVFERMRVVEPQLEGDDADARHITGAAA